MKRFDGESAITNNQSSNSTTWTVDVWHDIYLSPARAAAAVALVLAALAVLVTSAADAPLSLRGYVELFGIVWCISVVPLFVAFYSGAVLRFERRTGIDWNRDGKIGNEPAPAPKVINISLHDGQDVLSGGQNIKGEAADHLTALALGWVQGRPLTQEEWESEIKRDNFNALRDRLLDNGCAVYRNGRNNENGWKLTERGERVFQSIVDNA